MAPKAKRHTEKAICLLCGKEMMYKNLEACNKSKHKGEKLKYTSTHSRHLSSLISTKGAGCGDTSSISEVKMEEERLLSPCRVTSEVVEPPLKVLCLDCPAKREFNKTVDAKLEEVT